MSRLLAGSAVAALLLVSLVACSGSGGPGVRGSTAGTPRGAGGGSAAGAGATIGGCELVTADDLNASFGTDFAAGTRSPTTLDAGPNCTFTGPGDVSAIVQVTRKADTYFPADMYSSAGSTYPGAVAPKGADRGLLWNGTVLVVRGGVAVDVVIIDFGGDYSTDQGQALADRILARL